MPSITEHTVHGDRTMNEDWQQSWESFVNLLMQYLPVVDELSALLSRIAGKKVTWTGVFEKATLSELAPNVYIGLPSKEIDFGDGRAAIIDGISLPIAQGSLTSWAELKPGSRVKFEAVMG